MLMAAMAGDGSPQDQEDNERAPGIHALWRHGYPHQRRGAVFDKVVPEMIIECLLAGETHQCLGLGQGAPAILGMLIIEGDHLIGRAIDHKDRHYLHRI